MKGRYQVWLIAILSLAVLQLSCAHVLVPSPENAGTECGQSSIPTTVLAAGIAAGSFLAAESMLNKARRCNERGCMSGGIEHVLGMVMVGGGGGLWAVGELGRGLYNAHSCRDYLESIEQQTSLQSSSAAVKSWGRDLPLEPRLIESLGQALDVGHTTEAK